LPIGEAILAIITTALDKITPAIQGISQSFSNLSPESQKIIVVIGAILAALGPALLIFAKVVTAVTTITTALKALNLTLLLNPWALAAVAAIAAVVLIIKYWEPIKEFFANLFGALKDLAMGAFNFVKDNWKDILLVLTGPFGPAILIIKKSWDTIKNGASSVVAAIKSLFGGIGQNIVSSFTGAIERASKFFNNLRITASNTVNAIINLFRNLQNSISTAVANILKLPGFSQLANVFGKITGIFKLPGRADGGPVSTGQPYIVGERGPEVIIPNRNGYVLPNNVLAVMLGSSTNGSASYTVNVYNPVAEPSSSSIPAAQGWLAVLCALSCVQAPCPCS
jgi:phage-related protein